MMINKNSKIFQMITVVVLSFAWLGYGYSFYCDNENNMASYLAVIFIFSLINSDILFTKQKVNNTVFNVLAKVNGLLFFIMTMITIITLIIK